MGVAYSRFPLGVCSREVEMTINRPGRLENIYFPLLGCAAELC